MKINKIKITLILVSALVMLAMYIPSIKNNVNISLNTSEIVLFKQGIGTKDFNDGSCQNFKVTKVLFVMFYQDIDDGSCK
jgi:hypothetical protein